MADKRLTTPMAEFKNSSMANNRFYGPLAKLYEGPLNDIRQKVVEEGWFTQYPGQKDITKDLAWPASAAPAVTTTVEVAPAPQPGVSEAQFTDVYGPPMQAETPRIEPPTIDQPMRPRIDP